MTYLKSEKKGGEFRTVVTLAADNDTFVLPKGCKITGIFTETLGTTSCNISLGSTNGGTDIMSQVTSSSKALTSRTIAKSIVSMTADTTIYINMSAAIGLNLYVQMAKIN